MFRTYKRTIKKLKLTGRTVALVHREAELSLLATQILLAHADLALRPATAAPTDGPVISPRKVLIAIRKEIDATAKPKVQSYRERLARCRAEVRTQASPKSTKPPKPPCLHTLSEEQKAMLDRHMGAVG
jgi:hypothetical protein